MALGVHPIGRHECVSLGLDRDILLTEDRETRSILETTNLQGTSQNLEEPLNADDEASELILTISDLLKLGAENEIVEEKDGSPPGWQRLKRATERELGLETEGSVHRTDVLHAYCTEGMTGVLR